MIIIKDRKIDKDGQVNLHLQETIGYVNILIVISKTKGIHKKGKWIQSAKDRFYNLTLKSDTKFTMSMNGTACLSYDDWEKLMEIINNEIYVKNIEGV